MIPLRDSVPTSRRPWVTYSLIFLNCFIFLLEFLSPDLNAFIDRYALVAARVSFLEPLSLYPFLTSQFLHAGLLHLLFNMWFLRIFGDNVEEAFGHFWFGLFYLFWGVFAGLTQYIFMTQSTVPMLGASGAVAGALGAYYLFFPHHRIETLIPVVGFWRVVDLPASMMLFYWFAVQLFAGVGSFLSSPAAVGGVAFFAHAGGFLAGWVMAKIWQKRSFPVR